MMHINVQNNVVSEWANEVEKSVLETIATLKTIPMMKKHMLTLTDIYLFDNPYKNGHEQYIGGSYSREGKINLCLNKLRSKEEAIYVFLHEFAHHVANCLAGIDSDYDSKSKNQAYFKEEIRADALAMMLLKKYFNQTGQFSALIKTIKQKVHYMVKRFKRENVYWQSGYFYTVNSSNWDLFTKPSKNLPFAA